MGRHERVAELARLDADDLVVADLGCGTGRTVRALLAAGRPPRVVHALDQVSALEDDLLADARVRSRIIDLDAPLPLPDAALDRAVSLNCAEHLADPVAHLVEVHRALAPGGLLVLAHSDWDTALFTSADDALTRALVDRFTAAAPAVPGRGDGFMGRKLLALAAASGARGASYEVVDATSWADPHRRFDDGSLAWKVATGVLSTAQDDPRLAARAAGWLEELRALAAAGQFLFTVTDVAVVLRRA
ncbi:methyltransferase domain-containing protein [Quadrisphaera sp. DSM 44207]|uniref:methyltransferase domain-containing protein n=1 Tax=Quadrisphaera sp. DSM 44207 TaxID=1881057 RepID=UPI000883BF0E|nr:methyltransferase domain-containing protein [Quadrisphaera sp. DSM 44207]SDQ16707.1 Methyltransferase domain-containing protein [Quadrisphaera sp. DSM 44207]